MARKEFTYRGRSLADLQGMSIDELALLFNSDARRKIKRGFTAPEKNLLKKLEKRDKVKTHEREMLVLPSMVGKTILVHNGKEYLPVLVQAEMIGNRFGCYSLTRKPVRHTSAGMGGDKAAAKKDDKK